MQTQTNTSIEARRTLRARGAWPVLPVDGFDVWSDGCGQHFVYDRNGVIYNFDLETRMATLAELAKEYNALVPADKRIKRFATKEEGEKRLKAAKKEAGIKGDAGRPSLDYKVKFNKSPEGKIWHAESIRSKVFKEYEGKTILLSEAIGNAKAFGAEPNQVKSAIQILIKDKHAGRIEL